MLSFSERPHEGDCEWCSDNCTLDLSPTLFQKQSLQTTNVFQLCTSLKPHAWCVSCQASATNFSENVGWLWAKDFTGFVLTMHRNIFKHLFLQILLHFAKNKSAFVKIFHIFAATFCLRSFEFIGASHATIRCEHEISTVNHFTQHFQIWIKHAISFKIKTNANLTVFNVKALLAASHQMLNRSVFPAINARAKVC